jgi:hypothetical protein
VNCPALGRTPASLAAAAAKADGDIHAWMAG